MMTKQLKQLKKDNPTLNNTELAFLYTGGYKLGYATKKYYKAIKILNKLGSI